MLDELRPVEFEIVNAPQVGDDWSFQLVRRTGDNIGLPWQQPCSKFTREGVEGWRFARRLRGCPVTRLDRLHRELRGLEAASADPESGLERTVAAPIVSKLQEQLAEVSALAAAMEDTGADRESRATPANNADVSTVVFYQSADGQLIFLEPYLTKKLLAIYGTWAKLPPQLSLKSLTAVHDVSVTDELLRRHRFLSHLAVGGEVTFLDGKVEQRDTDGNRTEDSSRRSSQKQYSGFHRRNGSGAHGSRAGRHGGYSRLEGQSEERKANAADIDHGQSCSFSEGKLGMIPTAEQTCIVADDVKDAWDD